MRLGNSDNKCTCAKIKNRNIQNFGFDIELFHSPKNFNIFLLKDAMPVSFSSELFTSYILTTFKQ